MVAADLVLFVGECAPDGRRHAEDAEQVRRHACREEPLGFALAGEIEAGDRADQGDLGEYVVARLPVAVIGAIDLDASERHLRAVRPEADKPIGLAIRQRAQHHAVDHAENCRRRADTEGDDDDAGHRKGGGLVEETETVDEIGDQES